MTEEQKQKAISLTDVIHFYLGCEVFAEEKYGTLEGVSTDAAGCSGSNPLIFFNDDEVSAGETPIEEVKLVLRPLSDMTEEELKEIKHIMLEYENLRFKCDEKDAIKYTNVFIYDEIREDGAHVCTVFSSPENLPAKSVPWFTKHGFDIYDLIRKNQAIDKTKL